MNGIIDLSVVIPYYRGYEYIDRLVQSLLPIKHSKEIIIIDDGSNDDSFAKLMSRYNECSEVVLVTKKNEGIAGTRNYGVGLAKGEYILFCDQDDVAVPETIDKALQLGKENSCDACFWSTGLLYDDVRGKVKYDSVFSDTVLDSRQDIDDALVSLIICKPSKWFSSVGHLWSGLYSKEFIRSNDIKFKRYIAYDDDRVFLVSFLSSAKKVQLLSDIGYFWYQNRTSRSHSSGIVNDYSRKQKEYEKFCIGQVEKTGLSEKSMRMIKMYLEQKLIVDAIYQWAKLPGGNSKKNERNEILKNFRSIDHNNFETYMLGNNKRRKISFGLIKRGSVSRAFLYNRFYVKWERAKAVLGGIKWNAITRLSK